MPFGLRNFVCLTISITLVCCSHHSEQKKLEITLDQLQCEGALQKDPYQNWADAAVQSSETIGKNVLAYTYIASNYTAEVLWDTTAGVVVFVGLCAPMIASSSVNQGTTVRNSTPRFTLGCIPASSKKIKAMFSPPLGRQAVQRTQSLRCPDTKPLFSTLEKLITCYQKRDDGESLQKALQTMNNLESSEAFYQCLSSEQQLSLQNTRLELQKRSAQINGA